MQANSAVTEPLITTDITNFREAREILYRLYTYSSQKANHRKAKSPYHLMIGAL